MPISGKRLDEIVRRAVDHVPNATAERVHRLFKTEFAEAEHVLEATAGEYRYLLVIDEYARVTLASVQEDGAVIRRLGKLKGVQLVARYTVEINKTNIFWWLEHPKLPHPGELDIDGSGLSDAEREATKAALECLLT